MFWRSVVGKLWFTILLMVSFVLFILTVLLLEFFENYHVIEAEEELLQTAGRVAETIESHDDRELGLEIAEQMKDPSSRIMITFGNDNVWMSSEQNDLPDINEQWVRSDPELARVFEDQADVKKIADLDNDERQVVVVGTPFPNREGGVFVYQPLDIIEETSRQTTKIIFLAAGIAIFLTTIFAFFLSTRITAPLIKMREGALELAEGEFNTKIPILTHDEIGELAMAFNRMGRQLKYHINAVNQEKEQLSGILSSMADGVITFNRQGEILITNPPAGQYLEAVEYHSDAMSNGEVTKEQSFLPDELSQLFNRVITQETEVMTETNVQGRTWVIIMTPLYDKAFVRGAVAVIRDMTEERRLDKLRKDFIANVSHELRTPISMLQGYSEAIVDDVAETNEEKNELADIIHDESLRIGRLVNELLDLARMEAGHISLSKEAVDVSPFIERIIHKFQGPAQEKQVDLRMNIDMPEQYIDMDPDRIEQVMTNLIDNAIRHTPVKGTVEINVTKENEWVEVSIQDSGTGIAEEDLPFVFERFYKADRARKRKDGKKGTGLGLAIAKNIVEAHDGFINVHSKEGKGTIFSFHLPEGAENSDNL
ncbi:ATP-binding protein [Thalassobacillus sp. CUG 92003]|uniref:ATP-binding protein n=1 Tax=Thalassobacillus sp. CUG 92003 TaxID=2736641 RepID=UPI0015E79BC5|nr:ATP-binding protein [Thalassobacillus sp. CUG 92003]